MTDHTYYMDDAQIEVHVRVALNRRTDFVLGGPVIAASPTSAEDVRFRGGRRQTKRRIGVAAAVFVVSAIAVSDILRHSPSSRTVKVVANRPQQTLARLALHTPTYRLLNFGSYQSNEPNGRLSGVHVRNGVDWFDVDVSRQADDASGPGSTELAIGVSSGRLYQEPTSWHITWDVGGKHLTAYGLGTVTPKTISTLALASVHPDGIGFTSLPSGYIATDLPIGVEGYGATYSTGRKNVADVSLEVQTHGPFAADYFAAEQVQRGTRSYSINTYKDHKDRGLNSESFRTVSWLDGPMLVQVSGWIPSAELLNLADTVAPASPQEWADMIELDGKLAAPSVFSLLDGSLDATSWEFLSHVRTDGARCQPVEFVVGTTTSTQSCAPDSSDGPVRLLQATRVEGSLVVYGLTDADGSDSYVIRVIDEATNEEVAEDVTQDELQIAARAFVLPLDAGATGPFTVEVYEFERQWFIDNHDTRTDNSYLRPDSDPVESATVAAP